MDGTKKCKMVIINMEWAIQNAIDNFEINYAIDVSVQVHRQDRIRQLTKKEERLWEKLTSIIEENKK